MAISALDTIAVATPLEQLTVDQVEALQTALATLGYGLDADGILGPPLTKGWASFKSDNGLDQPDLINPGAVAILRQRLSGGSVDDIPHPAIDIVKTFEDGTTVFPNGSKVARGQTATEALAYEYLAHDMLGTVRSLTSSVPHSSTMNVNQHSALISFGYNLDAGFYGTSRFSSISSALRDHRWSDVPGVFALSVTATSFQLQLLYSIAG